jgi:serine protease Do
MNRNSQSFRWSQRRCRIRFWVIREMIEAARMTRPAARMGRAAWLLIPVLLVAGAAATILVTGSSTPETPPAAVQQRATRTAANDTLNELRNTALVRAAQSVAPAVVSVNVRRRETVRPSTFFDLFSFGPYSRDVQGLGSGFIIDPQGLVLTNEHVVRGATEVFVTLADGRGFSATVAGYDDVTDLALLRLTDPRPSNLPVAPLGVSDDLVIGEWVVAIGNPFGYLLSNPEPTVTAGVISGVGRNIIPGDGTRGYYLDMIQTDASINPGNSGGALVNALGQVIGVNSSIISESGGSVGLGFAIPIDRARRIAGQLQREGRVRRVWVGADVRTPDSGQFGRPQQVEVAAVADGSPAARAGIRPGLVIDSVQGRPVRSPLDWEARLLDARVGETLNIVARAGGARRTFSVSTSDLPSLTAQRVAAGSDFEFITVTSAIQAERNLGSSEGALIVQLSDAARSIGLQENDVVLEINRTRIRTAQEAASILRRLSGRVRMTIERRGQLMSAQFYIG